MTGDTASARADSLQWFEVYPFPAFAVNWKKALKPVPHRAWAFSIPVDLCIMAVKNEPDIALREIIQRTISGQSLAQGAGVRMARMFED